MIVTKRLEEKYIRTISDKSKGKKMNCHDYKYTLNVKIKINDTGEIFLK